jgi:hypothetical protein
MVVFHRKFTKAKREITKMASLSKDNVPPIVLSVLSNQEDEITAFACRGGIQISVDEITIQHLARFCSHRGGKGNSGKKLSAEHRDNIRTCIWVRSSLPSTVPT